MKTTTTLFLSLLSLISYGQYDLNYLTDPIGWPVEYPGSSSFGELDLMIEQSDSAYTEDWLNETKFALPKNTQGDVIVFGNYIWDATNEEWVAFVETNISYTYNSSDEVTDMVRSQGAAGFSQTRYATYTINSNGDYTIGDYVDSITFGSTSTYRLAQDVLTYNGSNQLTQKVYKESSAGGGTLEDEERFLFTWSGGRVSEIEEQNWDGSVWEADELQTLTYDANGNLTEKTNQFWNGSSWQNDDKDVFTFDAQDRMASRADYVDTSGTWDAEDRTTYAYINSTSSTFDYWVEEAGDGTTWSNDMRWEAFTNAGSVGYAEGHLWDGTAYEDDPIRRILFGDTTAIGGGAPTPPTNLGANNSARTTGTITLIWEDNSNDETGFYVERGSDGVNFNLHDSVLTDIVTYEDTTGLASGTQYFYRVLAYNENGISTVSNTADATTNPLAVEEHDLALIHLYPNPALDFVNVFTPSNANFRVQNIKGDVINSGKLPEGTSQVSLLNVPAGFYIMSIDTHSGSTQLKVVIQ
jgi:hypothetical protein